MTNPVPQPAGQVLCGLLLLLCLEHLLLLLLLLLMVVSYGCLTC